MVEITWLGHGTYQFRLTTGEVILVDPWIEGNPGSQKTATAGDCDCVAKSTSGSALTTAALPIVFRNFRLGRSATNDHGARRIISAFSATLCVLCVKICFNAEDAESRRERREKP